MKEKVLTLESSQARVKSIVLAAGSQPDIPSEPPLLVIEIPSPDDTYSDTQGRAQDYRTTERWVSKQSG